MEKGKLTRDFLRASKSIELLKGERHIGDEKPQIDVMGALLTSTNAGFAVMYTPVVRDALLASSTDGDYKKSAFYAILAGVAGYITFRVYKKDLKAHEMKNSIEKSESSKPSVPHL